MYLKPSKLNPESPKRARWVGEVRYLRKSPRKTDFYGFPNHGEKRQKTIVFKVGNPVAAMELKEVSVRETPIILSNCALLLRKDTIC